MYYSSLPPPSFTVSYWIHVRLWSYVWRIYYRLFLKGVLLDLYDWPCNSNTSYRWRGSSTGFHVPRLCPYMIGPTELWPHDCAHTRLWPDTFVPRHICAQTRLCPDTLVPRHISDQTRLCPDTFVPRHICAQTCMCPDTNYCGQTRSCSWSIIIL